MSKSFYFTRHGRCSGDAVTEDGYNDLYRIRMQLFSHAVRSKCVISSTAKRCEDTGRYLAAGKSPTVVTLDKLHTFGDIEVLRKMAPPLLELITKSMGDEQVAIVATHDSMSVVLAWTLLEQRGVAVNWWLPRELRFLEQGEGILVKEKTYWHLHSEANVHNR